MTDAGRRFAPLALVAIVAALAVLIAGCGIGARQAPASFPVRSVGPAATVGPEVTGVAGEVRTALGAVGLQLDMPVTPYRPAETTVVAATPRQVFQVPLPDDRSHGYIVIYSFRDEPAAAAAGRDLARYLASGPGRVQFTPDTRHVLRLAGPTLVFYSWSPENSPDSRTPLIAEALATVGQDIPIGS